uniref:HMG domain-containing protein 3 isoform X2 n=1 Tax=Myxine glutinosa TaxID=7769 RepID=UPI00359000D5
MRSTRTAVYTCTVTAQIVMETELAAEEVPFVVEEVEGCCVYLEEEETSSRKGRNRKRGKDETDALKKPKKPRPAYLHYYLDTHAQVQELHPELSRSEINKKVSEAWRRLPVNERRVYVERTSRERAQIDPKYTRVPESSLIPCMPGFRRILPRSVLVVQPKEAKPAKEHRDLPIAWAKTAAPDRGESDDITQHAVRGLLGCECQDASVSNFGDESVKLDLDSESGMKMEMDMCSGIVSASIIVEVPEERTGATEHAPLTLATPGIEGLMPVSMETSTLEQAVAIATTSATANMTSSEKQENFLGPTVISNQPTDATNYVILSMQRRLQDDSPVKQEPSTTSQRVKYTRRGRGLCTSPQCTFSYPTRYKPRVCPSCGQWLGGVWQPRSRPPGRNKKMCTWSDLKNDPMQHQSETMPVFAVMDQTKGLYQAPEEANKDASLPAMNKTPMGTIENRHSEFEDCVEIRGGAEKDSDLQGDVLGSTGAQIDLNSQGDQTALSQQLLHCHQYRTRPPRRRSSRRSCSHSRTRKLALAGGVNKPLRPILPAITTNASPSLQPHSLGSSSNLAYVQLVAVSGTSETTVPGSPVHSHPGKLTVGEANLVPSVSLSHPTPAYQALAGRKPSQPPPCQKNQLLPPSLKSSQVQLPGLKYSAAQPPSLKSSPAQPPSFKSTPAQPLGLKSCSAQPLGLGSSPGQLTGLQSKLRAQPGSKNDLASLGFESATINDSTVTSHQEADSRQFATGTTGKSSRNHNRGSPFELGLPTCRGKGRCKTSGCNFVYMNRYKPAVCPKCGCSLRFSCHSADSSRALSPEQSQLQCRSTLRLLRHTLQLPEAEADFAPALARLASLPDLNFSSGIEADSLPSEQNGKDCSDSKLRFLPLQQACGLCGTSLCDIPREVMNWDGECWLFTVCCLKKVSISTMRCQNSTCLALHTYQDIDNGLFNVGNRLIVGVDLLLRLRQGVKDGENPRVLATDLLLTSQELTGANLTAQKREHLAETMTNGYWAFECLTVRDYNDMVCGVCGIAPKVEIGKRNPSCCLSLQSVEFTWPDNNSSIEFGSSEVNPEDFWHTMESVAIEQAFFPTSIAVTHFDAPIVAPFLPPLARAPMSVRAERHNEKLGIHSSPGEDEGDCATLLRSLQSGKLKVEDLRSYSWECLAKLCSFCDLPASAELSHEQLGNALRILQKNSWAQESPGPGCTGGRMYKTCPHQVVTASKFLLGSETAKDHVDLLLASRHWPPVYISDIAGAAAQVTSIHFPLLAARLWGQRQGCLGDPTGTPPVLPMSIPELAENIYGEDEMEEPGEVQEPDKHPITHSTTRYLLSPSSQNPLRSLQSCSELSTYTTAVSENLAARHTAVDFYSPCHYFLFGRLLDFITSKEVVNIQISSVVANCQPGQVVIRDGLFRIAVAQIEPEVQPGDLNSDTRDMERAIVLSAEESGETSLMFRQTEDADSREILITTEDGGQGLLTVVVAAGVAASNGEEFVDGNKCGTATVALGFTPDGGSSFHL